MLVVVGFESSRFEAGIVGRHSLAVRSLGIGVGLRIVAVGFLRMALRRVGLGRGCMVLAGGRLRT
jgi:hypothetical protein